MVGALVQPDAVGGAVAVVEDGICALVAAAAAVGDVAAFVVAAGHNESCVVAVVVVVDDVVAEALVSAGGYDGAQSLIDGFRPKSER